MKFAEAKAKADAAQSGIPDIYADREQIKAQNVYKEFINDAPVILRVKPKMEQVSGKWTNKLSSKGNKVIKKTVFIPIIYEGKKMIVVTTEEKTVAIIAAMMEGVEPRIIKDAEDALDRHIEYIAPEPIEGGLRFVREPKKYSNNEVHDVCVLDSVEI